VPSKPETILLQGSELLKPLFLSRGFVFAQLEGGNSSGGGFASGEFRRADRSFEFHVRSNLGMVVYHLGTESISHHDYMLSVLGKPGLSSYPGFSTDPLDAFRNLHDDLRNHCDEFLDGTNEAFLRRVADARSFAAKMPRLPE